MSLNLGLEYEVEGIYEPVNPDGWLAEIDGTLRGGGMEYILRGKQPPAAARKKVATLLDELGSGYTLSHRCSTHIHIDTHGLSGYSRIALLLGLIIHDEWFFQFGKERQVNNYCTPVLYSPCALASINRAMRSYDYDEDGERLAAPYYRLVGPLSRSNNKYNSINTMTLQTLGTIELRHFPPLMDLDVVDAVFNKIEELYSIASKVPERGSRTCMSIWDKYEAEFPEEVQWTRAMYQLHNTMVGK